MTVEEAMQMLAKAWLEAPRKSLGHTSDGRSRGDLVRCPACQHLILMAHPGATEHLAHHREVAALTPFRFWLELAPITGMLPVALLGGERLVSAEGMLPTAVRATEFIRKHRALLVRAGILRMKRSAGGDFALIAEEEFTALCGMTAQEDFAPMAVEHYTQQAFLRPPRTRKATPLVH